MFDKVRNLASKAKKAIDDVKDTKISRTDYRVSVLNDFSIVSKAVFYVLNCEYDEKHNQTYKVIDKLPVQINPDHLYHAAAKKPQRGNFVSGGGKSTESFDGSSYSSSIEIQVYYDIYDDYLSTGEGLVTDARSGKISLLNEEYTTLPKLLRLGTNRVYGNNNSYGQIPRVYFKWGEVEQFGIVSGVNAEYTAFSRWGSPLKCTASVTMELEEKPDNSIFSLVNSAAEVYTKQMDMLNYSALAAQMGTEELAGVALGAVQSLRSLI